MLAVFSYFCHSNFIFKGTFDESPEHPEKVHMLKDQLWRHIIQFTSMSLNLTYICIFLINKRRDCIIVNSIVWAMFVKDTLIHPGKND